jgi:6-phosphogluconolactonase/glucosamine-6-phosphate isomerase/deaminase
VIIEITTVNPPPELKPFVMDERWVAYEDPKEPGEPMIFVKARRAYLRLGNDGHLGFLAPDVKPDWSEPLAGILSKKGIQGKRKKSLVT